MQNFRLLFAVLAGVLVAAATGCSVQPEKVHVVLIDGGANTSLPAFSPYEISQDHSPPVGDHGTQMLSIILGVAPGSTGMALDPHRTSITSINVRSQGDPTAMTLAEAIDAAAGLQPDVISISMGVRRHSSSLAASVERATSSGALVVAAAGNIRFLSTDYPARYSQVVSVGAAGDDGALSSLSAKTKVDRIVPAENIPAYGSSGQIDAASGTSVAAARFVNEVVRAVHEREAKSAQEFAASAK